MTTKKAYLETDKVVCSSEYVELLESIGKLITAYEQSPECKGFITCEINGAQITIGKIIVNGDNLIWDGEKFCKAI